jgi:hypothetical protein
MGLPSGCRAAAGPAQRRPVAGPARRLPQAMLAKNQADSWPAAPESQDQWASWAQDVAASAHLTEEGRLGGRGQEKGAGGVDGG